MRTARLINAALWLAFWLALAIVFDGFTDFRRLVGQGGIPLLAWFLSDWALRRIARRRRARW